MVTSTNPTTKIGSKMGGEFTYPQKIGSKMGGEFTYPKKIGSKMGGEFIYQPKWDPIGFDPQPYLKFGSS